MSTTMEPNKAATNTIYPEEAPVSIVMTTGAVEKHALGDDVGVTVLQETGGDFEFTAQEAATVLRKIDLHLLPVMCVTYLVQFLDKACVSYAALWGMSKDAHLVGSQYSWLTSIFYLAYLAFEFPTNYLFQKVNITKACGVYIALWGVVLLCMTPANKFAGLATARFFMGALECAVSPCFVLLTGMFYKKNEQPFRNGIWFSMNGLAQIIGALIGYGIGFIHADIPSWKFPFVIWGSVTIVWGVVFYFFTPPNPTKARWLTAREKTIAVLRLVENETGIDNSRFKWYQVREAFTDIQVWLIILFTLASTIPNGATSAFGPLIVNGFGYSTLNSALLNMPIGAAQVAALWISGYLATKISGIRHLLMEGGIVISILGGGLIYGLPAEMQVGRLFGYYLLVGYSVAFVLSLGLIQANIAGRTKKNIVTSSLFVAYCVGNLIGPQLFFTREAPRYQSGFISMLVCFGAQMIIVGALWFYAIMENRRRDKLQADSPHNLDTANLTVIGMSDLTDKENIHFRYML